MPISFDENTEVVSLDGKKVGKLRRMENDDYFIVYKKGVLRDEEFRIPTSAALTEQDNSSSANGNVIRLNMSEEALKHGYEFVKGRPNSDFMHGIEKSQPKASREKEVIHFDPSEPADESNKTGMSSPPISKQHQAVSRERSDRLNLYSCDMCSSKFNDANELQKHRGESHKAPMNI